MDSLKRLDRQLEDVGLMPDIFSSHHSLGQPTAFQA